jgi:uncharacterized protein YggE
MYDARPKIRVNGEALVNVAPDKITIRFGIETWDAKITVAKEKNNAILKKVVEAAKAAGVADKDMQTDYLAVEPRYQSNYPQRNIIDYRVRNTILVTLKEARDVDDVVTKALEAGATRIHGVEFQTTELKKYREQARELALKAAKEKAEKMAAVLGQTVGMPIEISEIDSGSYWWYYSSWSWWDTYRRSGTSQNVVQDVPGEANLTGDSIALGTIGIRGRVYATFELTP